MKNFKYLLLVVAFMLCLVGCGKSNEETPDEGKKEITYKEYTTQSLKYELPSEWVVSQEADGSLKTTNLGDYSGLTVLITPNVPSEQFQYFGETFMTGVIKGMDYTMIGSYKKNTYGSYNAYDYEAETLIKGQKTPVKITTLNVSGSAVTFMLVYGDENYNYEEIYSHLLKSIQ